MSGGNGEFAKELKKHNTNYEITAPSKKEMDVTDVDSLAIDFSTAEFKVPPLITATTYTEGSDKVTAITAGTGQVYWE